MKKLKLILVVVIIIVFLVMSIFIFLKIINNYKNKLQSSNGNNSTINNPVDTSEKIGKLYSRPNNIYDKKTFVKEISQNEVNDIQNIIDGSEEVLAIIDYTNAANYVLKYNDKNIKNVEFRTAANASIIITTESIPSYHIYKANDVLRLKEILGIKDENNTVYNEMDIGKMDNPPTLYIGSTKIYQNTYIWRTERVVGKDKMIAVDMISPQQMLKDVATISTQFAPIVSTNENLSSKTLTRLPDNARIQYSIYKGEQVLFDWKNAEKMIDGSYHMEIPNISGEYIYILNLEFEGVQGVHSTYCFKYKV